jgi:hypothetical protein
MEFPLSGNPSTASTASTDSTDSRQVSQIPLQAAAAPAYVKGATAQQVGLEEGGGNGGSERNDGK